MGMVTRGRGGESVKIQVRHCSPIADMYQETLPSPCLSVLPCFCRNIFTSQCRATLSRTCCFWALVPQLSSVFLESWGRGTCMGIVPLCRVRHSHALYVDLVS